MNDLINAHPLERKERIAFDLMLKIAHCNCKSMPVAENSQIQQSDSESQESPDTMQKEYLIDLYRECLCAVNNKKGAVLD